jgi:hypothetical protein
MLGYTEVIMSETEEITKTVQKTASFGEKSLEFSQKVGGFFAKVFKEPIEEVTGMVTDKLRFVRWRRLVQMSDDVNNILEDKGINDPRAVPPKLALPIFEEASLEEDPSLQQLWNHLLANSMNPDFNGELSYGFVDMIKNITAIEVSILDNFYETIKSEERLNNLAELSHYSLKKEQIQRIVNISVDQYQVSIHNLMRMQCIGPAVLKSTGIMMSGERQLQSTKVLMQLF